MSNKLFNTRCSKGTEGNPCLPKKFTISEGHAILLRPIKNNTPS